MYDTKELAVHLGVPESTIVAWRRLAAGPSPVKIAGRSMYLVSDVEAWLDSGASIAYGVELGRFVA